LNSKTFNISFLAIRFLRVFLSIWDLYLWGLVRGGCGFGILLDDFGRVRADLRGLGGWGLGFLGHFWSDGRGWDK